MSGIFFLVLFLWNDISKISTYALKFPKNFTFSACSAAYQIEGAWNMDGKGESIWDRFTHTREDLIQDGTNGDYAVKSYNLYQNDSNILKEIGFQMYRFSLSWPRILPNGDLSEINQAGIRHYNDMINDLLEKNIQPMVTIYHWDLPQKLQDTGGWLNSSIVDHITNYADLLFNYYGDRVKWWLTINEPYIILQGYSNNVGAPGLNLGSPTDYKVAHNLLIAHMRIYRLYERKYKDQQKGKITISLYYDTCFPKTKSKRDLDAVERHFQFTMGIFAHPIYSKEGDYPKLVRDIVKKNSKKEGYTESRLPSFTKQEILSLQDLEMEISKGTFDYFSFNHYTSYFCSSLSHNKTPKANSNKSTYTNACAGFSADMGVQTEADPTLSGSNAHGFVVNPKAFRVGLKKISMNYNYPEIFVTENGYSDFGELNDTHRIDYLKDYLTELLNAYYYDRCNIIGYTAFSLVDNFEWTLGYTAKFGLVAVDFNSTNRKRTRKMSSYYIQKVIAAREINTND